MWEAFWKRPLGRCATRLEAQALCLDHMTFATVTDLDTGERWILKPLPDGWCEFARAQLPSPAAAVLEEGPTEVQRRNRRDIDGD